MKKVLLTGVFLFGVCSIGRCLTPQDISNQQNEASVNILIDQYLNSVNDQQMILSEISNYKSLLNLNGVNWTGLNATNVQSVNWALVK